MTGASLILPPARCSRRKINHERELVPSRDYARDVS